MSLLNRIRAVIFDVDNTLLASDTYCQETILQTLEALASDGTRITAPFDDVFRQVFRGNLPFEMIFQTLFPEQWELVLRRYREIAGTKPYRATPHACETIQMLLNAGLVVGLVTNREKLLKERLTQVGFDPVQFAFIYQPTDEHKRKPHPSSLDRALDHLLTEHKIHREQILLVGDHMDDMWAARAHDIDFMAVLQGGATRADFVGNGLDESCMLSHLGELEDTLKQRALRRTYRESLTRVSAIDGRHARTGEKLTPYFSEFALHRYRIAVEVEHLLCLDDTFPGQVLPRKLTQEEWLMLETLRDAFSEEDAFHIMEYDHLGRHDIGPTEHDVKSCELWMREKFAPTSLADIIPYIHIFLTSEDVNNLAYKLMLADAVNDIFAPDVYVITDRLAALTETHLADPVMSRTHVQPASPTTFGKIFINYLMRLMRGLERLKGICLTGKVNGAVGNYNAFTAACPNLEWMHYSHNIVDRLGFNVELFTDQRGPHTDMIRALQAIQEINNVLRDLATDLSLYAAFGTMYFSKVESHVGSSTMPHKVNPWFAEVAESNCKKANALINVFANELDVSRLQRDLSDHDFERSYGEAVGYTLVAIEHLHIALDLIRPDTAFAMKELESHPEVVTEAIQTVLRHAGKADAYDQLKTLSRGMHPSLGEIRTFILALELPTDKQDRLLDLIQPGQYTGLAARLAKDGLGIYRRTRAQWQRVPFRFLAKI
ncbi:MAG: lyase family protein [Candidatus Uhrbacteria bacterium]|nr:lyase family protein [Candidatus Uhrbacteria bacterium]